MGQIQWTVSLIMIGLFAIAIISFAIGFANDNNSAIDISSDSQIMALSSNLTNGVSLFQSQSENTYASIINSTIAPGSTTTTGSGQYAITSTSSIGVTKNILLIGYTKIFGSNNGFSIFITTFLGILVVITILYVVKTWRAGIPD